MSINHTLQPLAASAALPASGRVRMLAMAGMSATLAFAALGFAGTAQARDHVGVSVGISVPGVQVGVGNVYPAYPTYPVYSQPRPVYVQPRPVYVQPRPVYIQPRPVYYAPQPVYYAPQPVYYGPQPVYVQRPHRHGHRGGYYAQPPGHRRGYNNIYHGR